MYLGSNSWRKDNGEPSHFTCEYCDEKKLIKELSHNDEGCNDCYAKKIEDELNLYGEGL